MFLIGLGVLLYPTVSDFINNLDQKNRINDYEQVVSTINKKDYSDLWNKAKEYNDNLRKKPHRFKLSEEEQKEYNSILNVTGDGVIGYIEIEKLDIKLPIAHGMGDVVLEKCVGHMEGTSMPCGGANTHSVLVAHRGLPSAKLFTDLDQMEEGDIFTLHILNEVLTYKVFQIKVVDPDHMNDLDIEEDKDYVTLVTCTPYAVNTHRLLVTGARIPNMEEENDLDTNEAASTKKHISFLEAAPIIAASVLLITFIVIIIRARKMRR